MAFLEEGSITNRDQGGDVRTGAVTGLQGMPRFFVGGSQWALPASRIHHPPGGYKDLAV